MLFSHTDAIKTLSDCLKEMHLPPEDHLKIAQAIEMMERNYDKPMEAEWVSNEFCSRCGVGKYNWFDGGKPFGVWNYCPGCGAKMKTYLDD